MKVVVIDGAGGGMGKALVEGLKKRLPGAEVIAVGLNALATAAMLRAGADAGATGENPVRWPAGTRTSSWGPSASPLRMQCWAR